MTYQSRFGSEEWLTPYTDKTLQQLPKQGVKKVKVICPGFSADCLETLEEIQEENKEYFLTAGGKSFEYIPALNDNQEHIDLLSDIIKNNLIFSK
jgi:ferrochelatase